ncbi:DUF4031 domain-containing protein [Paucibacter soli]|uniref:DUF4031 domain-containing protein n=1 Tax=Paucibacter soli TaxID=3133433 RepID=UPI003096602E
MDDFEIEWRGMKMSHMIADSDEELHAMAAKIGVQRRWWQSPEKTSGSHYDICLSMKAKAIKLGAIAITDRQCASMNRRRQVTGVLGDPESSVNWVRAYRAHLRSGLPLLAPPLAAFPGQSLAHSPKQHELGF